MVFERVYVSGPEPTELSQPVIDLLHWFWPESVETALGVHRGFDEASLAQHTQVL